MPEGFFPLAEATLYLATAPKSNSVGSAYMRALQDAQATLAERVGVVPGLQVVAGGDAAWRRSSRIATS